MNVIEFSDMNPSDESTFPKKRGKYLIVYDDGSGIKDYQIVYYRPPEDGDRKGFYMDSDCDMENELRSKFKWKPLMYLYLPNLLDGKGEYPNTEDLYRIEN